MKITFGTDGWRGIIARDFTFDNVRLCAQGVASYLHQEGLADRGLVVGYDTRFASEEFAAEVAGVLAGNGVKSLLCSQAAPTPVVSYNVLHHRASGAAIITASHNPAGWSGFKYKPDYAGSASPEVIAALERAIAEAAPQGARFLPLPQAKQRGLVQEIDPAPPYLHQVASLVDTRALAGAGLRVVVDAMFGAGAGYLPRLIAGGATQVLELHSERNPAFPGMSQPEPVAHNLKELSQRVVESGADVGLALDGDADRLGVVDQRGTFITPLQTFALLALYLLEGRGERGPLVKSITSTSMLFRLGELFDVPVHEAPVGFKYIGSVMMQENALMGGEESGGFGFRGHIPERDGILSGLLFLEFMVRSGKGPAELLEELYRKVGPHHYQRRDLSFPPEERQRIQERLSASSPAELAGVRLQRTDRMDGVRFLLVDGSWVVVRFSGTEPLLRLYAEASSPQQVERLLEEVTTILGL